MIKCNINLSVSYLVIFLPFLYDLFVIIFNVCNFENVDANIPLIKRYGGIAGEWMKWLEKDVGRITCKYRYPAAIK